MGNDQGNQAKQNIIFIHRQLCGIILAMSEKDPINEAQRAMDLNSPENRLFRVSIPLDHAVKFAIEISTHRLVSEMFADDRKRMGTGIRYEEDLHWEPSNLSDKLSQGPPREEGMQWMLADKLPSLTEIADLIENDREAWNAKRNSETFELNLNTRERDFIGQKALKKITETIEHSAEYQMDSVDEFARFYLDLDQRLVDAGMVANPDQNEEIKLLLSKLDELRKTKKEL